MKKTLSMGMVIGFAAAVLGAMAVSPNPGYSADIRAADGTKAGEMTPEEAARYRDEYNKSFTAAREAKQAALEESAASSSGGCCG
ncbi:MAG: hypothetical protein HYZ75_01410 [Elusimicrobia bacterium]|nr:hypothetical protein [Elusimicrobiota bacterium]